MKRWRYNVYRVPGETRDGEAGEKRARGEDSPASESDTSRWRQADSVYEDVM